MPKKKRCKCGGKIESFMEHCLNCLSFCRCGRRIDYSGRGRVRSQCEFCAELRHDRRVCPCGTPLVKSQRVYCSARCSREARRIRNGAAPRDGWTEHIATAFEKEKLDCRVAMRVAVWLRALAGWDAHESGMAILFPSWRWRIEARWTPLEFSCAADLPQWVPVDDRTRLETMQMRLPKLYAYALSNSPRTAIAVVSAQGHEIAQWRERRCFVPRYADYDVEMSAPAEAFDVYSLLKWPPFGQDHRAPQPQSDEAPSTNEPIGGGSARVDRRA